MKRKYLAGILVVLSLITLVGCGKDEGGKEQGNGAEVTDKDSTSKDKDSYLKYRYGEVNEVQSELKAEVKINDENYKDIYDEKIKLLESIVTPYEYIPYSDGQNGCTTYKDKIEFIGRYEHNGLYSFVSETTYEDSIPASGYIDCSIYKYKNTGEISMCTSFEIDPSKVEEFKLQDIKAIKPLSDEVFGSGFKYDVVNAEIQSIIDGNGVTNPNGDRKEGEFSVKIDEDEYVNFDLRMPTEGQDYLVVYITYAQSYKSKE